MESKHIGMILVSAWIGTAIAVSIGIYITHSTNCLWAMFIPAFLGTKTSTTKESGK